MSMTGGFSFFEKNKALFKDGATIVASSNQDYAKLALGLDQYMKWFSSGSDDTTTETLTITLPSAKKISRLFLITHNFKEFTVKYGVGGASHFSNVIGLDGANATGIVETANERAVNYYEFDEVTTDTIVLTATKTIAADQEKELTQLIATTEIGTLRGYPTIQGINSNRNIKEEKSITGRSHIEKQYESFEFSMTLKSYPYQDDLDILDGLHNRNSSFLVWPCGGRPQGFRLNLRGWRVQDIFQMQTDRNLISGFEKNIYSAGASQSYSFTETVE